MAESIRIKRLEKVGLQPLFPVWGLDTTQLAQQMIEAGCCAHLTCIDPRVCPHELAGAAYDAELLAALPPNVDHGKPQRGDAVIDGERAGEESPSQFEVLVRPHADDASG